MGSGKSCLSHVVIDDLSNSLHPNCGQRLAYFYINGVEARAISDYATRVLRCLVRQLVDSGPRSEILTAVQKAYEAEAGKADLDEKETIDLLHRVVEALKTSFLVIDGLDECPRKGQRRLVAALSRVQNVAAGNMELFWSSRPAQSIENCMASLHSNIITIGDQNRQDISALIARRVEESVKDVALVHLYKRVDEDKSSAVAEVLQRNAQGMFRWVQMAVNHLNSSQDFWTLQDQLKDLPRLKDLFDLYDEMYDTTLASLGQRSNGALRLVLLLMLHANPKCAGLMMIYAFRKLGKNSTTDFVVSMYS